MGNSIFSAVKVFTVTKARDREQMGDRITEWLRTEWPKIFNTVVTQSSDREFHCFTITIFYTPR